MADDDAPEEEPESYPIEPPVDTWEVGDDFLATWVSLCNESGMEIGITLLVRGAVITGLLAPAPNYFEDFGDLLASAMPVTEESKTEMRRVFAGKAMSYRMPFETHNRIGYVHIKNAQILHGDVTFPRTSTSWLRLRLSEISGWILGNTSRQES